MLQFQQFYIILCLISLGIPIIYYGSEQGFHGGRDPDSRESLWPNYNEESELYLVINIILTNQVGENTYLW